MSEKIKSPMDKIYRVINKHSKIYRLNRKLHSKICGGELKTTIFSSTGANIKYSNGYICPKCRKRFSFNEQDRSVLGVECLYLNGDKRKLVKKPNNENSNNTNKSINYNDYLIITEVRKCIKNHELIDIIAIVPVIDNEHRLLKVEVPAAKCVKCNKYYILEENFYYLKTFGKIVCNTIEYDKYKSMGFLPPLKEESDIYKFGYNVSENIGLSRIERWQILETMVDSNFKTRTEIVEFLTYLINFHSSKKDTNARMKWEEDIKYIQNYKRNELDKYEVKTIKYNK